MLFAIDAVLVHYGLTRGFDQRVLHALRRTDLPGVAISPAWTVRIAIWITALGGGAIRTPVTIVGALALVAARRTRAGWLLAGAVASGVAALVGIKLLFHRARPELAWQLVAERDFSFPSGHAMGSMIVYPLLGLMLGGLRGRPMGRRMMLVGVAIALAVGATRVFLGVHWASDVVGGWLIGGAWLCAWLMLDRR